jgi:hypothetical protein
MLDDVAADDDVHMLRWGGRFEERLEKAQSAIQVRLGPAVRRIQTKPRVSQRNVFDEPS